MKKFFEKYDLLKVAGILVLLTVALTWVLPRGSFSGATFTAGEITRVGLQNFLTWIVQALPNFAYLVSFLLILGGFYQVLSKRAGYQKLVKTISEKLKGREIPVVLFVALIFACLSSLSNDYFPLMIFIPFVVTILSGMKVDKITSFVATFGGILVGTIGSTYGSKVAGMLTSVFTVEAVDILTTQTILFVAAFVLLSVFTILRLVKAKKNEKKDKFVEYDKFAVVAAKESKDAKKTRMWPYIVMMALLFVVTVLAYLPWETWEITAFTDATKWVNEWSIAGQPILSYIFGAFTAFGEWDIYTIQIVLLFATLLIHWFGKMSFDELCENYGEGFKKLGYTSIVALLVYLVVVFSVMFPVLPTVVDWLEGFADGFNAFLVSVGAFVTSIFSGEMYYAMSLVGGYYAAAYAEFLPELSIIFQALFGLVSFFVPSSVVLMLGLSYLDIPYKDWLKFIWKFLLAMLVIIIIIIVVIV